MIRPLVPVSPLLLLLVAAGRRRRPGRSAPARRSSTGLRVEYREYRPSLTGDVPARKRR